MIEFTYLFLLLFDRMPPKLPLNLLVVSLIECVWSRCDTVAEMFLAARKWVNQPPQCKPNIQNASASCLTAKTPNSRNNPRPRETQRLGQCFSAPSTQITVSRDMCAKMGLTCRRIGNRTPISTSITIGQRNQIAIRTQTRKGRALILNVNNGRLGMP